MTSTAKNTASSANSNKNKQCEIAPIEDNRMRKAALRQRQPILVKKAMELSILCKCAVRLTIWNEWTNELIHYESSPLAVPSHLAPAAVLSNADYATLFDDSAATPAAAARALDSFVRSPKNSTTTTTAAAAAVPVLVDVPPPARKRPRVDKRAGAAVVAVASNAGATAVASAGLSANDAMAPSVKLSRKLHEVIESKSKQQQQQQHQQQQQQLQLPRMSPRLRANMPPPLSAADAGVVASLSEQQQQQLVGSTSVHSFLPPLPMTLPAAAGARNRKKLSVVIPDTPTLPSIPAQHLDLSSAVASTSLTSQSPAGMAPPLSAYLMPQASARPTRSGTAPSLDIQMSPLASPSFFDRPSPMTRSALAALLSASSTTVSARSAQANAASIFMPTPSLRASGSNAGPFANFPSGAPDVFTPK